MLSCFVAVFVLFAPIAAPNPTPIPLRYTVSVSAYSYTRNKRTGACSTQWANNEAQARLELQAEGKLENPTFGIHYNTPEQTGASSEWDGFMERSIKPGEDDDDDDDDDEDDDEDEEEEEEEDHDE